MVRSCAAWYCSNRNNACFTHPPISLTFHSFPAITKHQKDLRRKWEVAVRSGRRDGFQAVKGSQLCSLHFEDFDFETDPMTGRRRLKPDAVPTKFYVPNDVEEVKMLTSACDQKPHSGTLVSRKPRRLRKIYVSEYDYMDDYGLPQKAFAFFVLPLSLWPQWATSSTVPAILPDCPAASASAAVCQKQRVLRVWSKWAAASHQELGYAKEYEYPELDFTQLGSSSPTVAELALCSSLPSIKVPVEPLESVVAKPDASYLKRSSSVQVAASGVAGKVHFFEAAFNLGFDGSLAMTQCDVVQENGKKIIRYEPSSVVGSECQAFPIPLTHPQSKFKDARDAVLDRRLQKLWVEKKGCSSGRPSSEQKAAEGTGNEVPQSDGLSNPKAAAAVVADDHNYICPTPSAGPFPGHSHIYQNRVRELSEENRLLKKALVRHKMRLKRLQRRHRLQNEKQNEDFDRRLREQRWPYDNIQRLSPMVREVLVCELKNADQPVSSRRYSDSVKEMCKSLYKISPKAYDFLRGVFNFPAKISHWQPKCVSTGDAGTEASSSITGCVGHSLPEREQQQSLVLPSEPVPIMDLGLDFGYDLGLGDEHLIEEDVEQDCRPNVPAPPAAGEDDYEKCALQNPPMVFAPTTDLASSPSPMVASAKDPRDAGQQKPQLLDEEGITAGVDSETNDLGDEEMDHFSDSVATSSAAVWGQLPLVELNYNAGPAQHGTQLITLQPMATASTPTSAVITVEQLKQLLDPSGLSSYLHFQCDVNH